MNDYLSDNYEHNQTFTDGTWLIDFLLKKKKIKNLNILGFTYFSEKDNDIINKYYLKQLNCTENQKNEALLIKMLVDNNVIINLENIEIMNKKLLHNNSVKS